MFQGSLYVMEREEETCVTFASRPGEDISHTGTAVQGMADSERLGCNCNIFNYSTPLLLEESISLAMRGGCSCRALL